MERKRTSRRSLAVAMTVIALSCAPAADADPTVPPECNNSSYAFTHRQLCDVGSDPIPDLGPGAGGGGPGQGLIGRILGGLGLGGLL